MTRVKKMDELRHETSLRLHFEMHHTSSNSNININSNHPALDDSVQTLVDTTNAKLIKPLQEEFLEYVQRRTRENDQSLSQLSLCVNDSVVNKKFDEVYEKGKILGEGGFAFVYQCRHLVNGHTYAVKEVIKSDYEKSPSGDEIKQEIAALRIVKECPHFVRLLDVFHQVDRTYLIMEEMKGGDLLDKLGEIEVYEEWEARKLIRTLLEAVAYCHKRKIAHRDLKPENILLPKADDSTAIKLADFGCAKQWTRSSEMVTLCGSPQYVAPEVVGDRPAGTGYSNQCDLWSVGVILYIVLGGYAPFESEDEHELVDMICNAEYEFHEDYWEDVEEAPKSLIEQLLEVNPRKRLTARQALNSPWLRRRDGDWIKEMDDSQSSFGAWLEKRNSSLHASSNSSRSKSTGHSRNMSRQENTNISNTNPDEWGPQDSNRSLNSWWNEEETEEGTVSFAEGPLSPGPGQDSSTTGFSGDAVLFCSE